MNEAESLARSDGDDPALQSLLEAIYVRFHYDFRGYARSSLSRRLRCALSALSCGSLLELQERSLQNDQSFATLLQFLTVPVSELFREPASFSTLRQDIVPVLRTYPFIRMWIAGCSTGEEAYSYAIVLAEEGLLDRSLIYATDINRESLRVAEAGVFSEGRLASFELNHRLSGAKVPLSVHYTRGYGSLVFSRRLRERIAFSDHSLVSDGVFAEVQLVSCRNVLIYFQSELRERALALFNDSLCRRGFLGLGGPETLRFTAQQSLFEELPERWYRRC